MIPKGQTARVAGVMPSKAAMKHIPNYGASMKAFAPAPRQK
jgi:hypothetical protein